MTKELLLLFLRNNSPVSGQCSCMISSFPYLYCRVETDLLFLCFAFNRELGKFQTMAKNACHFLNRTLSRYRQLIDACGFVAAVGQRRFLFLLLYINPHVDHMAIPGKS